MCDSEVLFALVLLRAPRNFLRHFLNLLKATKIAIESFKNNCSVMRNCGNWLSSRERGYWSGKNPTESRILRGHDRRVRVRWRVSNGIEYAVFIRFGKYFVNDWSIKRDRSIGRSVAKRRNNHNLGSVMHDGLHFANAGNGNGAINSRKA